MSNAPVGQWVYASLKTSVSPFILAKLMYRAYQGRENSCSLKERLGASSQSRPSGPLVWFHASSLGESAVALPVIYRCLQDYNEQVHVLFTTASPEARTMLSSALPSRVNVQLVPLDNPICTRLFIAHWTPQVAIFLEGDLRPCLVEAAHAAGVRMALLNARIPPLAFLQRHTCTMGRATMQHLLSHFALIIPQSDLDVARFRLLGASLSQMPGWCSDLKYAAAMGTSLWHVWKPAPDRVVELKRALRGRPTWLAAWTHPGEEEIVGGVHRALRREFPQLLTLLVPRNSERCSAVAAKLRSAGLKVALWSDEPRNYDCEVLLVDAPAELPLLYCTSEVAFIGNSLIEGGVGHSLAEAAVAGCAVLVGPHASHYHQMGEELNEAALVAAQEAAAAVSQAGTFQEDRYPADAAQQGRGEVAASMSRASHNTAEQGSEFGAAVWVGVTVGRSSRPSSSAGLPHPERRTMEGDHAPGVLNAAGRVRPATAPATSSSGAVRQRPAADDVETPPRHQDVGQSWHAAQEQTPGTGGRWVESLPHDEVYSLGDEVFSAGSEVDVGDATDEPWLPRGSPQRRRATCELSTRSASPQSRCTLPMGDTPRRPDGTSAYGAEVERELMLEANTDINNSPSWPRCSSFYPTVEHADGDVLAASDMSEEEFIPNTGDTPRRPDGSSAYGLEVQRHLMVQNESCDSPTWPRCYSFYAAGTTPPHRAESATPKSGAPNSALSSEFDVMALVPTAAGPSPAFASPSHLLAAGSPLGSVSHETSPGLAGLRQASPQAASAATRNPRGRRGVSRSLFQRLPSSLRPVTPPDVLESLQEHHTGVVDIHRQLTDDADPVLGDTSTAPETQAAPMAGLFSGSPSPQQRVLHGAWRAVGEPYLQSFPLSGSVGSSGGSGSSAAESLSGVSSPAHGATPRAILWLREEGDEAASRLPASPMAYRWGVSPGCSPAPSPVRAPAGLCPSPYMLDSPELPQPVLAVVTAAPASEHNSVAAGVTQPAASRAVPPHAGDRLVLPKQLGSSQLTSVIRQAQTLGAVSNSPEASAAARVLEVCAPLDNVAPHAVDSPHPSISAVTGVVGGSKISAHDQQGAGHCDDGWGSDDDVVHMTRDQQKPSSTHSTPAKILHSRGKQQQTFTPGRSGVAATQVVGRLLFLDGEADDASSGCDAWSLQRSPATDRWSTAADGEQLDPCDWEEPQLAASVDSDGDAMAYVACTHQRVATVHRATATVAGHRLMTGMEADVPMQNEDDATAAVTSSPAVMSRVLPEFGDVLPAGEWGRKSLMVSIRGHRTAPKAIGGQRTPAQLSMQVSSSATHPDVWASGYEGVGSGESSDEVGSWRAVDSPGVLQTCQEDAESQPHHLQQGDERGTTPRFGQNGSYSSPRRRWTRRQGCSSATSPMSGMQCSQSLFRPSGTWAASPGRTGNDEAFALASPGNLACAPALGMGAVLGVVPEDSTSSEASHHMSAGTPPHTPTPQPTHANVSELPILSTLPLASPSPWRAPHGDLATEGELAVSPLALMAGAIRCPHPAAAEAAAGMSHMRYWRDYVLPASQLPQQPHGPAVWRVSNEAALAEAVATLLREPLERRSRGHAAAQAAAKLASGLVGTVWQVLDDAVVNPVLDQHGKMHGQQLRAATLRQPRRP